ncbi:MAG TPA: hypothetical protein PK096_00430 [Candidatus Saccharibacteria bacterium]|nr:hypothetical protein [Candidatus Saccharibacteria bacterium]HRK93822.1 hypothetical protein [Candidatus Saccharibacteria bacterium]
MDERQKPVLDIQPLLALEGTAEAVQVLRDYEEHQKDVLTDSSVSSDEEYSHTRYYAETSVEWARRNLWDTIVDKAFSRELTFDQTVSLLRYFGFNVADTCEADYTDVLTEFFDGQEILLKQDHHYLDAVHGHIAGAPFIAPFADRQDSFRAMIYADITADGVTDGELIPIVTRNDKMTTPTVVVGQEAIEAYLQSS